MNSSEAYFSKATQATDEVDANVNTREGTPMDNSEDFLRKALKDPGNRVVLKYRKKELVKMRGDRVKSLDTMAKICDPYLYQSKRHMKSGLYPWLVFIGCVFYTLPASQLMLANQMLKSGGNGDICYYNYLCRAHWGMFEDYGHFFSNVSYVVCGFAFVFLVTLRRTKRYRHILHSHQCPVCNTCKDNPKPQCQKQQMHDRKVAFTIGKKGIPEQYGIFYALGGALISEGLLSATYHLCPTRESFQFDTTFMYVIAILLFLKIYQFRHPDVTANAYKVFALVSLALTIEVISYYSSNIVFWFIFIMGYLIVLSVFTVETYYHGNFTLVLLEFFGNSKCKIAGKKSVPRRRIWFFFVVVIINIGGMDTNYYINSSVSHLKELFEREAKSLPELSR